MKCKHCGQSIKEKKPAIKKEDSFEYFTSKTLERVRGKLKTETGYGIPERRINDSQEKN